MVAQVVGDTIPALTRLLTYLLLTVACTALRRVPLSLFEVKSRIRAPSALSPDFLPRTARPGPLRDARRRSTIKLMHGPGIASPGLARVRVIVHMVSLYNILTDTPPPRARPGPPRPSSASGGPRPRRGAAASQIRRQSTGTRSGDLRSSEAYALPIQGYHMDLSTGACGGAGGPGAQPPGQLTLHTPYAYTHLQLLALATYTPHRPHPRDRASTLITNQKAFTSQDTTAAQRGSPPTRRG